MSAPLVSERTSEESTILRQKAAPIEPAKGPPAESVANAAHDDNLPRVPPPQPAGKWKPPPARWIALIFCITAAVTLCCVWLAQHLSNPAADVILSVTSKGINPTLVVNGNVLYRGKPVWGKAQITIQDLADGRFLESDVETVEEKVGTFNSRFPVDWNQYEPLKISADYRGQANNRPLEGTATCYLNATAPPSKWWWVAGALALFLLIVLFTGPLSPMKARLLFVLTYAFIFAAFLIPILAMVFHSGNWYLNSRVDYPLGILQATTDQAKQPQWWLHLGGSLRGLTGPPEEQQPGDEGANAGPQTAEPQYPVLKGGLSVPLYVLMLALLGALINALRQVPAIQKDSDSTAGMTLVSAPITVFRAIFAPRAGAVAQVDGAADIRRRLIETYMYFLSAPALAITVYYLLQAVGTVTQPTLVVVAFATGLITNTVAEAIIAFTDNILHNLKKKRGGSRGKEEGGGEEGRRGEEECGKATPQAENKKKAEEGASLAHPAASASR